MKKIHFLSILLIIVFSASCKKELDQNPISEATTETFYASENDFLQGVNAIYSNLRSYPDRQINLSETRSDNIYGVTTGGVFEWEGINSFHKTIASNGYVSEAWNTNFNGIFKANTFLAQLQQKGSAIITSAQLRNRFEAEAKFLRALFYFDLVRWFGKVPVADRPVSANEALAIPRSPVSDVYQLIVSDLQFAADNLPESNAAADKGRATKFAAKGLLALVHMTRSGPTYDIEGPGLALNEWSQALTLLNEVIASNKYSFLQKYSDIFSYTNENNAEVVFDVQYISGGLGLGATFLWILVPEGYFQSFGLPNQGGIQIRPVSQDLYNSFDTVDVRKTFSIEPGLTFAGQSDNRPFFKKYVDVTKYGRDRLDWPINFIAMRYTDILMMKAECILNGASGTQAEVDTIVNQVRKRAGLADISNVTLEQLMDERRKEFGAEGLRWHDLVRSGRVVSKMTAWIPVEDVQNQMLPFDKNYIIYPIPQSQIDVRQGLYTQNPGY